jgi:hypothetical protein
VSMKKARFRLWTEPSLSPHGTGLRRGRNA